MARSNDAGTPVVSPKASIAPLSDWLRTTASNTPSRVESQHRAFEHAAAMDRTAFRPLCFRDIIVNDELPWPGSLASIC